MTTLCWLTVLANNRSKKNGAKRKSNSGISFPQSTSSSLKAARWVNKKCNPFAFCRKTNNAWRQCIGPMQSLGARQKLSQPDFSSTQWEWQRSNDQSSGESYILFGCYRGVGNVFGVMFPETSSSSTQKGPYRAIPWIALMSTTGSCCLEARESIRSCTKACLWCAS